MKKFMAIFALFSALIFVISCGGGSKSVNHGDEPDTGETVTDGDTTDSEPADNDLSDSGHENPDTIPEQPDGGDTAPDNGDTEPNNDYPQTPCDPNPCISDANSTGACTIKNDSYVCGCKSGYIFDGTLCIKSLPECSPESATPCIDSATGLIWSAKSENKMPWNDAVNYCQNLTEGDFNDWRLPSIAVLKTLVQNCFSAKCADDYTGKYSKFGDTVYLWSSSENEDSTAQSIYFSNAGTQPVSIDDNINVRCVRRETESRQSNCTGLIENSVWNTASQITQIWDWGTAGWTPSPQGSYNEEGSSSVCRFKCDSNFFWDGTSKCLNPCEPNPCNNIGETGICVGKSANEYTKEYTCECEENYFWHSDSNKCAKNLCQENSCDIPNSTGICNPVDETQYACECKENYYWWGPEKGCIDKRRLTLGNICTGQNRCYNDSYEITCPSSSSDDFFGQDAYYAKLGKCTSQSFTVQTISSQNVVYDNNTGLMWQQTIPTSTYTWEDSVSYCDGLTYAGYSDWRLPTTLEFLTIVDNSRYNPAIDTTYFLDTPHGFWSSSTIGDKDSDSAYTVDFVVGGITGYAKLNRRSVRCVRGLTLPASSFNSLTINGDVIVADTATGLVWQKSYVSGKKWTEALSYCENLTYAGYSDWRLPDKNELASLVPASDFPDMPLKLFFWSSSTCFINNTYDTYDPYGSAWTVHSSSGAVHHDGKTSIYVYLRCVRNAE